MNLHKLIMTQNDCYKKGGKHTVKGVMWHSTGADNPYLSRYVGPDDGILGYNKNKNHWNQPMSRKVCVHAFIGYTKDKKDIATYQTLPWDMPGWHSGVGSLGYSKNANNTGYIGFEICEDDLKNREYFEKVYEEAIQLTVYLFKKFNLKVTNKTLIDHTEGNKLGVASNHGDVAHWFKVYGKSMSGVRQEVEKKLNNSQNTTNGSDTAMTYYKRGDKGSGVKKLQTDLNTLGYKMAIDSSFGPATEVFVKQFQKDNGLTIDGSAGPKTLAKIAERIKAKQSKSKGLYKVQVGAFSEKDNAEQLREELERKGYKTIVKFE